jgi:Na+/H+-dicarboxylate symporter
MTAQAPAMPIRPVPAGWTLAGLLGGLLLGLALHDSAALSPALSLAGPLGALWLRALQMTIVPLVIALLFTGIVQTVAAASAGAMARRSLGFFAMVLVAGGAMAALVMPLALTIWPVPSGAATALASAAPQGTGRVPGLADFLQSLVPANIFNAAASDAMLPLILFTTLFALASTRLADEQRRQLALFFEATAGAMMVVIGWVLALAPLGVFCLALGVAAGNGAGAIGVLAHYIALLVSIGGVILLAAYGLAATVGGQRLGTFARAMLPAQTVAISTQSSLASLPAMLDSCRRLGLRETSGEFVLPLAVALFRATSPAMNMAVAIYAAHLTGVTLTPPVLAAGVAVAALMALGTVSLPGTISFVATVGPIALAMGVPLGPLALLVAVEMLPDIMRTLANVTMDVAVTAVVDRKSAGKD